MNKLGRNTKMWTAVEERIEDELDNEVKEIVRKNIKGVIVANDPKVIVMNINNRR